VRSFKRKSGGWRAKSKSSLFGLFQIPAQNSRDVDIVESPGIIRATTCPRRVDLEHSHHHLLDSTRQRYVPYSLRKRQALLPVRSHAGIPIIERSDFPLRQDPAGIAHSLAPPPAVEALNSGLVIMEGQTVPSPARKPLLTDRKEGLG
jgi:hypothetical protein